MVEEFDLEKKQRELVEERESIQQEVAQLQADLQAKSLANPEFNTRQARQFINSRGEVADRLGREISILDDVRAKLGIAEREGQTISSAEQQRFFEARTEQVEVGIRSEFSRQRQIIAQRQQQQIQQVQQQEVQRRPAQPTPSEIEAQQSFIDPLQRQVSEEEFRRMQTLQPPELDFGQSLTREGLEEVRQQSLPINVVGGTQVFDIKEPIPTTRIERLSVSSGIGREAVIQVGIIPFGATARERERARQSAVLRDIFLVLLPIKIGRIGSLTKVRFTGVQQTVRADQVFTRIQFVGERGRAGIQRGVATSVSQIIPRGEGFVVKSITAGQRFRKVIEVPTGRTLVIPEAKFKVAEIGLVKVVGDKTISAGIGRVQKDIAKTSLTPFRSIAFARTRGRETRIISGVSVGGEPIIAKGIIKTVSRKGVRRISIVGGKPSTLNIQTMKQVSLASTQSSITGALQTPQISRVGITQLSISSTKISSPTRQQVQVKTPSLQTSTLQKQQQIQTPKQVTSQRVGQQLRFAQPSATRQRTTQISSSAQRVIQTPKQIPIHQS